MDSSSRQNKDSKNIKKIAYPGLSYFFKTLFSKDTEPESSFFRKALYAYSVFQNSKKKASENLHTYELISQSSRPNAEYFVLLLGSCFIATLGLLKSSAAIIIGGMLIAPLMVPILSFSLSIIWADKRLFANAFLSLILGILISIFLSALVAYFVPNFSMNSEIIARVELDLYDIFIALASGFIGAYAFVNPKISSSISGVAIAVALMPPLCVVGICLSQKMFADMINALILFSTNLTGISFAASFVFWRLQVRPFSQDQEKINKRVYRNIIFSFTAFLLVVIPLVYFMKKSLLANQIQNKVQTTIQEKLPNSQILKCSVEKKDDAFHVNLILILHQNKKVDTLQKLKTQIQSQFKEDIKIYFTALQSVDLR